MASVTKQMSHVQLIALRSHNGMQLACLPWWHSC